MDQSEDSKSSFVIDANSLNELSEHDKNEVLRFADFVRKVAELKAQGVTHVEALRLSDEIIYDKR